MSEQSKGRTGCVALAIVVLLLGIPILYVLALGPLVWIHDNGMMNDNVTVVLEAVYSPLAWAKERSSVAKSAIESYVALWKSLPPTTAATPAPVYPAPLPTPAGS